jgi:hypothetical protein
LDYLRIKNRQCKEGITSVSTANDSGRMPLAGESLQKCPDDAARRALVPVDQFLNGGSNLGRVHFMNRLAPRNNVVD